MLGSIRYAGHRSGADLGLFVQTLASPSFSNTLEGGNHFTYHFSPLLFVFVPLVHVVHSPVVLIVAQAVAGALVAPPVFLLARKRMAAHLARDVAVLALLYPPLAGVTFTDFHENGFAPAAALWLVWAFDARRYPAAVTFAVVLLAIKEDEAVILTACGAVAIAWFARRGEQRALAVSAGIVALASITFVAYFTWVRPLAGGHDAWNPSHFYAWDRNGPGTSGLDLRGRASYLLEAMVPLALVPLCSRIVVFAVPPMAEVLLSHLSITYTMGQHYAGAWIGWVLAAETFAVARLARGSLPRARLAVRVSTVISVLILALASPTHWGHFLHLPGREDRALDALSARIPESASIGTFDELYAHLGLRPRAQIGLQPAPDYAIDDDRYDGAAWVGRWRPLLRRWVRDGHYRPLASQDGVTLFAHSGPERQD